MSEPTIHEETTQSQSKENRAQPFIVNRAFTCVVTSAEAMPGTAGTKSFFIVRDSEGKLALGDVEHSLLNIPPAAVLTTSLEAAVSLLFEVRKTLFPDMSNFSGVQISVVHTEAMFDPAQGRIITELSLYPVQYVPLSTLIAQSPAKAASKPVSASSDESTEDTDVKTAEEVAPVENEFKVDDTTPAGDNTEVEAKAADSANG